ncbi:MAG TPA: glycosyltransferase [Solirubrobacteraceae bacterium]|nr:glycosyltransferase [Solirubrobacteraceae bacterium]
MSIGLAVYNGERFLAATLDSLLAQTFADFELIICDNASTDRSGEIATDYAARDRRIRYVRHPVNLGAGANYRHAFEASRAPYFRWSAADDLYARESLARCVEVLDREPSVVLTYPQTRLIDEQGSVIRDYDDGLHLTASRASERFAALLERIGYCNALYGLMRSAALRKTRLIGDFAGSDIVFQAELALYGPFWEIQERLFFRRLHAQASSSMTPEQRRLFYVPAERRRIFLRHWRHLSEHARSVWRAPLSVAERMRLARTLARMAVGERDQLLAELRTAARWLAA